ncbi:LVIVD repeat-containing protein [Flavobacterium selenitireducens]|uniref:hypothetical protein n=1 Tax=Flavobacterium selenitireducens TaxID=2722704 RepID=UPI00168B94B6|nr:hypothetical protein [Flavobacterium selenitireducens]MBD3584084.1 hypothetical protein [Flavobacterium selenitireducens]
MKKIVLLLLFAIALVACSSDSDGLSPGKGDGQGGSLAIFALKGNYLYTVDHSTLNVFSVIDRNHPVKVNEIQIGWDIETLFSFGENLYIGSRDGMYIYSVAQPENPTFLSSAQHMRACDPVVANQTHSFVTLHSDAACGGPLNVLQVYDTQNLLSPVLIHQRNLTKPRGLGLYHDYLFVCDDVIKVFDIANPGEPVLVTAIPKNCFDVIIKGDALFAIGDQAVFRYQLNPADIENITFKSQVTF